MVIRSALMLLFEEQLSNGAPGLWDDMNFEIHEFQGRASYVEIKTTMLYTIFVDGYGAGVRSCIASAQGEGHHDEQHDDSVNIVNKFIEKAKRESNE